LQQDDRKPEVLNQDGIASCTHFSRSSSQVVEFLSWWVWLVCWEIHAQQQHKEAEEETATNGFGSGYGATSLITCTVQSTSFTFFVSCNATLSK
jgi:hypothetical protein